MERRLAEALRQGFTTALIPPGGGAVPKGLRALEAATVVAALDHLLDLAEDRRETRPPLYLVDTPPDNPGTGQNGWR
jgi:DNA repair protein RadA/Sms